MSQISLADAEDGCNKNETSRDVFRREMARRSPVVLKLSKTGPDKTDTPYARMSGWRTCAERLSPFHEPRLLQGPRIK